VPWIFLYVCRLVVKNLLIKNSCSTLSCCVETPTEIVRDPENTFRKQLLSNASFFLHSLKNVPTKEEKK